jgi:hypothetical protein
LSSLEEEEHGGYVCHPRAPSGNNSRTHSFYHTHNKENREVLESSSLKLLRKKKRKKWTLLESLLVVCLVLLVK